MAEIPVLSEQALINFWNKVDIKGPDECWLWLGAGSRYGVFNVRLAIGKYADVGAHGLSLHISGRPKPEPLAMACHGDHCISTKCVNPAHLRWDNAQGNVDDKVRLGRQAKGTANGNSSITEADALMIIHSDEGANFLARRTGISRNVIINVRAGRSWRHLPRPETPVVIQKRHGRWGARM